MTDEKSFDNALRLLSLPICVVTVGRGGVENGLTVSWTSPVSFEPPHIVIAVDRQHYSVDFLKSTKSFVLNVLGAGHERIAGRFARQSFTGEEKLEEVATREAPSGAAVLADALAYFDCELAAIHEVGDHLLCVGKVVDAAVLNDGEPLTTANSGIRYRKSKPAG